MLPMQGSCEMSRLKIWVPAGVFNAKWWVVRPCPVPISKQTRGFRYRAIKETANKSHMDPAPESRSQSANFTVSWLAPLTMASTDVAEIPPVMGKRNCCSRRYARASMSQSPRRITKPSERALVGLVAPNGEHTLEMGPGTYISLAGEFKAL